MNLVFTWCVARIDPEKREQWEIELRAPLPGWEKVEPTPFVAEQEAADFMATLAMHQAQARTRTPA
jgi:hypothetical protein